jgi:hypothetical protein
MESIKDLRDYKPGDTAVGGAVIESIIGASENFIVYMSGDIILRCEWNPGTQPDKGRFNG